jgi:tetratricopeptide (TPR) repeat protein
VLKDQGKVPAAIEAQRAGLAIWQALVANHPNNSLRQQALRDAQLALADLVLDQSGVTAALPEYEKAVEIATHLAQRYPERYFVQRALAACLNGLGRTLAGSGDNERGAAVLNQSQTIVDALVKQAPTDLEAQVLRSVVYANQGALLENLSASKRRELLKRALEIQTRLRSAGTLPPQYDLIARMEESLQTLPKGFWFQFKLLPQSDPSQH